MNILALDLGTTTGWALGTRDGTIRGGSESFSPKACGGYGQRWLAFRQWLSDTRRSVDEIHAVYYEDVKHHSSLDASHAYGGFLAHVEAWCAANRILCRPVNVGTIKRHWTGMGNAKKDAMIATARAKGFNPVDDNHADALAILAYAISSEAGTLVMPEKPKAKKRKAAGPDLFQEAA
jgi:hypothetical protein